MGIILVHAYVQDFYCKDTDGSKIDTALHSGPLFSSNAPLPQLLTSAADGSQLCPKLGTASSYEELLIHGQQLAEAEMYILSPLVSMWHNSEEPSPLQNSVGWAETSVTTRL